MGIELPAELVEVAAATGAPWPQADEDAMREQAAAWRGTGQRVDTLAGDADAAASGALDSLTGASGEAASTAWSGFVDPDDGHLSAVSRGAARAADRLESAADEVGAAKVEMARQLVDAAKNRDAAGCVAGAGHPAALLGVDTTTRGAATNLGALAGGLATAVGPGPAEPVAGLAEIVDPDPGAHTSDGHAGSLGATTGAHETTVDEELRPGRSLFAGEGGEVAVDSPGAGVRTVFAGGAEQTDPPLASSGPDAPEPGAPPDAAHGPGIGVAPGGVSAGAEQETMLPAERAGVPEGLVGDADTGPIPRVEPATPRHGLPGQYGGLLPGGGFAGVPTPQAGLPVAPSSDQTSASGFTEAASSVNPAAGPGGAPSAGSAPAPGVAGPSPGPAGAGHAPVQPGGAVPGGIASGHGGGGTRQPPRTVAGGSGGFGASGGAAGSGHGGHPGGSAAPGGAAGLAPGQPAPGPPGASVRAAVRVPSGSVPQTPGGQRASAVAEFRVRMFPIGHLPVASDRPARQLPPPPADVDFGGGLRFAPGDHPNAGLLDTAWPCAHESSATQAPTRRDEVPVPPAELTEGYQRLAGLPEHDWNRRYLVREGAVDAEHVWPPGELYPEGCVAGGQAVLVPAGTNLDRFGDPEGRVFAPAGTAFAARSLPPAHLRADYRRYRVCHTVPMWRATSAPWFGQPGGGTRYRALCSVAELIAFGYLEETTLEGDGPQ